MMTTENTREHCQDLVETQSFNEIAGHQLSGHCFIDNGITG